ncbi:MAG TPA: hypothetical protein VM598_08960 [Bdellovibrionota bacterium]|nr:hypothetical protein [Bdellovibrionota bacterium]
MRLAGWTALFALIHHALWWVSFRFGAGAKLDSLIDPSRTMSALEQAAFALGGILMLPLGVLGSVEDLQPAAFAFMIANSLLWGVAAAWALRAIVRMRANTGIR